MIKTFLSGIAVGIANIIPGVSGGTMMVLLGIYDKVLVSISNIIKPKNQNRYKELLYIFILCSGGAIGIVGFANILDIMFDKFEVQTYYFFIGLLLSSLMIFVKTEFGNNKISLINLSLGLLIVLAIQLFNVDSTFSGIPAISLTLIIQLLLVGVVAGVAMIVPGVSGALLLLILGKYHLVKAYIANLFSFKVEVIFPVIILGIGMAIGVYLSAKIIGDLIKKYRNETFSFIVGLIVASIVIIVPFNINYNFNIILTSILSIMLGYLVVRLLEKV